MAERVVIGNMKCGACGEDFQMIDHEEDQVCPRCGWTLEVKKSIRKRRKGFGMKPEILALLVAVVLLAVRAVSAEEIRSLPEWLLPPPAVAAAFRRVFPIFPIAQTQTQENGLPVVVISDKPSSGFLVAGPLVVTAAHILALESGQRAERVGLHGRRPATQVWFDQKIDLAFLRVDPADRDAATRCVLPIRADPPAPNELVWWLCRGGLLANEWSVARYLGQVAPEHALKGAYRVPVYFFNPILGGLHGGCSGTPVLDGEGRVVGMITSYVSGGMVLNAMAIRGSDIAEALAVLPRE